ncbi:hypothetical protein BD410DRAFT_743979 [Rickenella mellea]|uniref:HTH TFE/IIEalpha-type domain-containing protein n=1 Tax=Rickenella mellea TaxID=50990 RepID=A0A4Y7QC36_9AGAM|nr:hypothetical protein BD410DRAFT_743979 [Rickenella mellea]
MATKEEQDSLRLLVQHVSRAFYEHKFVIIMDQLARHPVMKDEDLAGRMGLQAKELNKLMAVLATDRLVMVHRQNELKEGAARSIGRQYYYIDYQHFCNVVKWRVAEMRRKIDSGLRNELENKGYICPNCSATFAPLEVDRLLDVYRGAFICDQCSSSPSGPTEVVLNEKAENVLGSNDRMERFNKQTQWIRDGLKKSESMVLPAFDVSLWIKQHIPAAALAAASAAAANPGDGLKIAGSSSNSNDDGGIGVVLSVDTDEATRRKAREAEAEARREQNRMPAWHLKSTINGELTALGHAESGMMGGSSGQGQHGLGVSQLGKDGLAGLGKATLKRDQRAGGSTSMAMAMMNTGKEDVKPVIDHEENYFDQYYAALEAASQSQPTTQNPNTPQLELDDDFEFDQDDDDDERDRKPNPAVLDALHAASTSAGASSSSTTGSSFHSLTHSHSTSFFVQQQQQKLSLAAPSTSQWHSQPSSPHPTPPSRKRSRSRDDHHLRTGSIKALKSNGGTPVHSRGNSYARSNGTLDSPDGAQAGEMGMLNGDGEGEGEHDADMDMIEAGAGAGAGAGADVNGAGVGGGFDNDDPFVNVGGQPMPFSQITQEIADERMTPEEYTAWYDMVMAQGMV